MKKQQLVVSFPSYKLGTFHNPLPDIGRNDPCPCKSGKKYKRCCGLKQAGMIAAKCEDVSKRNAGYTPPATESLLRRSFRKGLTLIRKGGAK